MRNDMEVAFWGTRGGISTPGRSTEKYGGNTPCISVTYGDDIIIFDAGTGIRTLGNELVRAGGLKNKHIHLFLTHTHWDHIQGLPFFVPAYIKDTALTIYGSASKGGFLETILRGQMDYDYFPVDMSELPSNLQIVEIEDDHMEIGELSIQWEEQDYHPGGCLRYKVTRGDEFVVFSTDVELNNCFGKDYPTEEERTRAQAYLKFIQGCSLLIGDAQYTAEQYPSKVGWGHTSMELLMEIAHRAGVKRLAIYHHDPDHSDTMLDDLWNQYGPMYSQATPTMQVFWAREGMSLPV
jgi:phosphoribosyl 1,2-cyclic phosphodiesterase